MHAFIIYGLNLFWFKGLKPELLTFIAVSRLWYCMLDILVCSITVYFYESCKRQVKMYSNTTLIKCLIKVGFH